MTAKPDYPGWVYVLAMILSAPVAVWMGIALADSYANGQTLTPLGNGEYRIDSKTGEVWTVYESADLSNWKKACIVSNAGDRVITSYQTDRPSGFIRTGDILKFPTDQGDKHFYRVKVQ